MKSLFENFISIIVYVFIIFTITAFSIAEMQITQARHIHASVINQIQSSYYSVNINSINEKLHSKFNNNWNVSTAEVSSVGDRYDQLVTLDYEVVLPVFNITTTGTIQGYAR